MRKPTDDDNLYKMMLELERENREREKAQKWAEKSRQVEAVKKRLELYERTLEEHAAKRRGAEALRESRRIDRERIKKNAEEYDQIIAAQDAIHDITGGQDGAVSSGATAGTQGTPEAVQAGGDSLPKEAHSDLGSPVGKGGGGSSRLVDGGYRGPRGS